MKIPLFLFPLRTLCLWSESHFEVQNRTTRSKGSMAVILSFGILISSEESVWSELGSISLELSERS